MSTLNAHAANDAAVISFWEHARPMTVYNNDSSMPRSGTVSVHTFFFPGSSLSPEAALVGALARGHRFGEVCIEGGANFFEPNLVCLDFLLWTDRESLHALQNTNQLVQIPVPQIDFSV
jgi:hypothetical protein